MPKNTVHKIIVKAEAKNLGELKNVSKQLGKMNKHAKKTASNMSSLRNSFRGLVAVFGVREIARAADQFQLLRDRIKVFTGSSSAARIAFNQLKDSARASKTSIAAMAETYNRVALATKELGLTSSEIIGVTEALTNSFRLAGSTIAEATGATIQLTQGLSSGQLRGQELRSVLESNAVISNLLAKELGTTTGKLLRFAESGKITSQVVLRTLSKNFKELREESAKLGTTFEQSLTIGMDAVRFKIDQLNESFDINGKFARGMLFAVDNVELLSGAIISFVASRALVTLTTQLTNLGKAAALTKLVTLFSKANLIVAGLTAAGTAAAYAFTEMNKPQTKDSLTKKLEEAKEESKKFKTQLDNLNKTIENTGGNLVNFRGYKIDQDDALLKAQERYVKARKAVKKLTAALNELNNSPLDNLTLGITREKVEQLNFEFDLGKKTLTEYKQAIAALELETLNEKYKKGKIQVDEYNAAILKLSKNLKGVNQFALGAATGLAQVAKDASDVAGQISKAFVATFNRLEDSIAEFIKKGTFEFRNFAQAILDDLTKIIIRASIIAPLANAIQGSLPSVGKKTSGGGAPKVDANQANGGVWSQGNLVPFANGGIFNSPTTFPMSGGRTGLLGEAGPEAIIPLSRGTDGKLGVKGNASPVTVNIINNGSSSVQSQERKGDGGERIMDIVIEDRVKKMIGSGRLDRTFSDSFGVKRRGA